MKGHVLAAGLAALGLASPSALAGDGDGEGPGEVVRKVLEAFGTFDADGDGTIAAKEFPSAELFGRLDLDMDGALSRDEIGRVLKALGESGGRKVPGAAGKSGEGAKDGPVKDGPVKDGPAEGEDFAAWARRRVAVDPRFHAESRRTQFLANFDRDPKDGRIQRKEYAGGEADKVFRDFDRDRDGALDDRELLVLMKDQIADLEKARRRPTRGEFLVLFDLDEDRTVTRQEYAFLRGPPASFVALDDDYDGVVTYDELQYRRAGRDRRYRGKGGDAAAAVPPAEKRDVWGLYDKDGDGRVTAEEFGGAEAVFRRLDRNRDGSLTAADL